jgi:hypothetical protein
MKMIRFLSVMVLVLMLSCLSIAMASEEAPAPFCGAKALALKATPGQNGNHILQLPSTLVDETGIEYIIGYLPADEVIGIGMTDGMNVIVFMYCEKDASYSVFYNGNTIPIDGDKIPLMIDDAYKIFRKMVEGKLV